MTATTDDEMTNETSSAIEHDSPDHVLNKFGESFEFIFNYYII
jgi:hypothetical protein